MNKEDAVEEAKSLFWGAVGECDCDNESARKGLDAVGEFIEYLLEERDNITRIMADAADANARSTAYERVEHAKTAAILRKILAESGSYLQTKTREEADARIAIVGNCVCLPKPEASAAGVSPSDA
jgi:hypothetical protein